MTAGPQECLYVHPDNVEAARRLMGVSVAVVARPDAFLEASGARQLIVETERGVHTRLFLCGHGGVPFVLVYGRMDRIRGTSFDIDYALTQEALSFIGIQSIVGTFVVGSIDSDDVGGTVYVPHDIIGIGGFNQSRMRKNPPVGFRNVEMFEPFCPHLLGALVEAGERAAFRVVPQAVYACFHGWPRIETLAELNLYDSWGANVVGQTLDPEATLAREAGCHYAALAVTIDDRDIRSRFLANDPSGVADIKRHIVDGRKKTFSVFLDALPFLERAVGDDTCNCRRQALLRSVRDEHFYYRPGYLCVE